MKAMKICCGFFILSGLHKELWSKNVTDVVKLSTHKMGNARKKISHGTSAYLPMFGIIDKTYIPTDKRHQYGC